MSDPQSSSHYGHDRPPDLNATDPYRVLGLPVTATPAEIKRTYFGLIRQYPPETEAEKFKRIRAAYEKLRGSRQRLETDIFRPQPPPAWTPPSASLDLDLSFHPDDVGLLLRRWGELGQSDFQADFKEIEL